MAIRTINKHDDSISPSNCLMLTKNQTISNDGLDQKMMLKKEIYTPQMGRKNNLLMSSPQVLPKGPRQSIDCGNGLKGLYGMGSQVQGQRN